MHKDLVQLGKYLGQKIEAIDVKIDGLVEQFNDLLESEQGEDNELEEDTELLTEDEKLDISPPPPIPQAKTKEEEEDFPFEEPSKYAGERSVKNAPKEIPPAPAPKKEEPAVPVDEEFEKFKKELEIENKKRKKGL